jgi:hypothetical protein
MNTTIERPSLPQITIQLAEAKEQLRKASHAIAAVQRGNDLEAKRIVRDDYADIKAEFIRLSAAHAAATASLLYYEGQAHADQRINAVYEENERLKEQLAKLTTKNSKENINE